MGKFDGILICTDLDGTLYKSDKTISAENKEAIEYFKREGGYFTFITGRMPYYSMGAYREVEPNAPFGCINGGALYDGFSGEYISAVELPHDALALVEEVDKKVPGVGIQLCGFEMTCNAKQNSAVAYYRRATGHTGISCHYSEFNKPLGKIIFCSDLEEEIQSVQRVLRAHRPADEFEFIRTERILFELLPRGVNKGLAIKRLAEYLGLDVRRTVAIGDYDNDIAMLCAAGVGVAVANASKGALEAADFVTVSNEDHAVARVIYDLESGKYGI